MKRIGSVSVWGFLAEKTNKTNRKECLRKCAVVFKRMCQTSVYFWVFLALLYICCDSRNNARSPLHHLLPPLSYPTLLLNGSSWDAAVTGSLHPDPPCKIREIHTPESPSALWVGGVLFVSLTLHSSLRAFPGGSWQGPEDLSLESTSQPMPEVSGVFFLFVLRSSQSNLQAPLSY